MEKVVRNIVYCTVKEAINGVTDLAIEINGHDLIDEDVFDALRVLYIHGMIKDGENITIPRGSKVFEVNQCGGSTEYVFGFGNNALIKVDLAFDGDKEDYIK